MDNALELKKKQTNRICFAYEKKFKFTKSKTQKKQNIFLKLWQRWIHAIHCTSNSLTVLGSIQFYYKEFRLFSLPKNWTISIADSIMLGYLLLRKNKINTMLIKKYKWQQWLCLIELKVILYSLNYATINKMQIKYNNSWHFNIDSSKKGYLFR